MSNYQLSKNLIRILFCTPVIFATSACDEELPPEFFDEESVVEEAIADADFDEIDDLIATGMGSAESGISAGSKSLEVDDERFRCAQVSLDREIKTITIDFGEGCEGPSGRVRSGIIRIEYSGFRFIPGSTITTTLENFSIDGKQIEGIRVVENISESTLSAPTFRVTLSGGKITFEDQTTLLREVDRVRRWVRTANPVNDEFHIIEESTASGTNRRGESYRTEVLSDLVYKRQCKRDRIFIPVSGQKDIQIGENVIVIDFGDGDCDRIVTASFNGVIRTIEIPSN